MRWQSINLMVGDLWPGTLRQLARDLGCSPTTLHMLLASSHTREPVLLLERLHALLAPGAARLGIEFADDEVRTTWKACAKSNGSTAQRAQPSRGQE